MKPPISPEKDNSIVAGIYFLDIIVKIDFIHTWYYLVVVILSRTKIACQYMISSIHDFKYST